MGLWGPIQSTAATNWSRQLHQIRTPFDHFLELRAFNGEKVLVEQFSIVSDCSFPHKVPREVRTHISTSTCFGVENVACLLVLLEQPLELVERQKSELASGTTAKEVWQTMTYTRLYLRSSSAIIPNGFMGIRSRAITPNWSGLGLDE